MWIGIKKLLILVEMAKQVGNKVSHVLRLYIRAIRFNFEHCGVENLYVASYNVSLWHCFADWRILHCSQVPFSHGRGGRLGNVVYFKNSVSTLGFDIIPYNWVYSVVLVYAFLETVRFACDLVTRYFEVVIVHLLSNFLHILGFCQIDWGCVKIWFRILP